MYNLRTANISQHKNFWGAVFGSTLVLVLTAFYFQYLDDLAPCIMCIYQRTAVLGLMLSALLPTVVMHKVTQFVGLVGGMISSVWGLLIAIEHVDIQTAINPFFASCEIVPNFPSWAPLHEWLPQIFAATGDCGDIKWSFIGMSMPQWMIVIFAAYTCLLIFAAATALMKKKNQ